MQYFKKIHDEIKTFCAKRNVAAGFEVNFLKDSNSQQCKDILAIYEQASEILEDVEDVAERDVQLAKLYEDLLKIA